MAKSGWCTAAPGARIPHEGCRWALCTCECHQRRYPARATFASREEAEAVRAACPNGEAMDVVEVEE